MGEVSTLNCPTTVADKTITIDRMTYKQDEPTNWNGSCRQYQIEGMLER